MGITDYLGDKILLRVFGELYPEENNNYLKYLPQKEPFTDKLQRSYQKGRKYYQQQIIENLK
jgi:hypothetical protein